MLNLIGLFTPKNVIFYKIDSNEIVYEIDLKQLNLSKIIAASFIQSENPISKINFFPNSQFLCLNDKQELFTFASNKKKPKLVAKDEYVGPASKFAQLFNQVKYNTDESQSQENFNEDNLEKHFHPEISSKKLINDMFLNVPSHVLPPINILTKKFLGSMITSMESTFHHELDDRLTKLDKRQMNHTNNTDSTIDNVNIQKEVNSDSFDNDLSWMKESNLFEMDAD